MLAIALERYLKLKFKYFIYFLLFSFFFLKFLWEFMFFQSHFSSMMTQYCYQNKYNLVINIGLSLKNYKYQIGKYKYQIGRFSIPALSVTTPARSARRNLIAPAVGRRSPRR